MSNAKSPSVGSSKSAIRGGAGTEPTPASTTHDMPRSDRNGTQNQTRQLLQGENSQGRDQPRPPAPGQVPEFAKGKPGVTEKGSGLKTLIEPLQNLNPNQ